jgi:hypothetical protein
VSLGSVRDIVAEVEVVVRRRSEPFCHASDLFVFFLIRVFNPLHPGADGKGPELSSGRKGGR